MGKQKERWCVTGVSRLTGERVVISSPCSRENAIGLVGKELRIPPKKRCYIYPKIGRVDNYPPIWETV